MTFSYMYTMYFDLIYPPTTPSHPPLTGLYLIPQIFSMFMYFLENLNSTCERKHEIFVFLSLAYFT
jgi:hypothetical protein